MSTSSDLQTDDIAEVVWFDPGLTTGAAILKIDAAWLDPTSSYAPDFHSFGEAVHSFKHLQIGRFPRYHEKLPRYKPVWRDCSGGPVASHTALELECVVRAQDILDRELTAVWGYEDFTVRIINSNPALLSPARIGLALTVSELASDPTTARTPFTQSPSMAKKAVTDDRLKQAGLYCAGVEHANDAMRHAVCFLRRARADAALRSQAWPLLFHDGVLVTPEDEVSL